VAPFAGLPRRLKEDFRFAFMGGDAQDMQQRLDAMALDPALPCKTAVRSVHGVLDDIFPLDDLATLAGAWGDQHQMVLYENEAHVCLNVINQHSIASADWMAARLLPRNVTGAAQ
jgi:hypothetical protein